MDIVQLFIVVVSLRTRDFLPQGLSPLSTHALLSTQAEYSSIIEYPSTINYVLIVLSCVCVILLFVIIQ